MNRKSVLIRVPKEDFEEIKGISNELKITIPAAFNVWKNRGLLKLKWRNLR